MGDEAGVSGERQFHSWFAPQSLGPKMLQICGENWNGVSTGTKHWAVQSRVWEGPLFAGWGGLNWITFDDVLVTPLLTPVSTAAKLVLTWPRMYVHLLLVLRLCFRFLLVYDRLRVRRCFWGEWFASGREPVYSHVTLALIIKAPLWSHCWIDRHGCWPASALWVNSCWAHRKL